MNGCLQGKCIVIIGGSSGMGLSALRAFVRHGARVLAVGRPEDGAPEIQSLPRDQIEYTGADARRPETAVEAIQNCVNRFGDFHGLYHVAGGSGRRYGDGPLHELTVEGWNTTIDWNLGSLMLSNQAAIRHWLKTGTGGTILNMSSVLAYSPSPGDFSTHAYAAAKAAIIGLSRSVAATYAKENIRVNVIAPALVDTPMARRAASDPSIMKFIRAKQPLDGGRIGRPEDLDGLALYFMSDYSRFTTGQVIAVDGGWAISEGIH